MAYVHFLNREHESAIRDAEASVQLNPKAAFEVAWAGWLIGLSGHLERGRQLIDDMFETMYDAPGIGLAATQVDVHRRLLVADVSMENFGVIGSSLGVTSQTLSVD